MERIYLDHNATTPLDPRVFEAMRPWFLDDFGNASSVHAWGQKAAAAVDRSRRQVAELLGASPGEIVFTSGGTEADNLAVQGVGRAAGFKGHLAVSAIEHKATLASAEVLASTGMRVTQIPAGPDGIVDPEAVALAIEPDSLLVGVMFANNETGAIQPIRAIADVVHERGAFLHCDAVQAFGKIPTDVDALGADLVAVSGHKIYGPKGVGALYIREGTQVAPLIAGGSQEYSRRGGTTNVPLIVGFAEAARIAVEGMGSEGERLRGWSEEFADTVLTGAEGVRFMGDRDHRLPGTVNLAFEGLEGPTLVQALDLQGVAVSSGAACEAGATEPSHVLKGMGIPEEVAAGAVRFSFGRSNREGDAGVAARIVVETIGRMGRESAESPQSQAVGRSS